MSAILYGELGIKAQNKSLPVSKGDCTLLQYGLSLTSTWLQDIILCSISNALMAFGLLCNPKVRVHHEAQLSCAHQYCGSAL